jgi:hypothetical protein
MFKRRMTIGLGLCLLLAAGCQNEMDNTQARVDESGHAKPVVALVPDIDSTAHDLPWSLGDELTAMLQHRLIQKDKVYLVDDNKVRSLVKRFQLSDNPFGLDISWVKRAFPENEFVVFIEFLEHEEKTLDAKNSSPQDCSAELSMSVRLRVIDLRGAQPKIALQEMVHDTHYVPRQFTKLNFHQEPWGKESFNISPLGLAHAQLTQEIASRLEDYILLSND